MANSRQPWQAMEELLEQGLIVLVLSGLARWIARRLVLYIFTIIGVLTCTKSITPPQLSRSRWRVIPLFGPDLDQQEKIQGSRRRQAMQWDTKSRQSQMRVHGLIPTANYLFKDWISTSESYTFEHTLLSFTAGISAWMVTFGTIRGSVGEISISAALLKYSTFFFLAGLPHGTPWLLAASTEGPSERRIEVPAKDRGDRRADFWSSCLYFFVVTLFILIREVGLVGFYCEAGEIAPPVLLREHLLWTAFFTLLELPSAMHFFRTLFSMMMTPGYWKGLSYADQLILVHGVSREYIDTSA